MPSGFSLASVGNCRYKELPGLLLAVAKEGVDSFKPRISEIEYKSCLMDLSLMRERKPYPFHWEDGGRFNSEGGACGNEGGGIAVAQENRIQMPATSSLAGNRKAVEAKQKNSAEADICIGHFVAFQIEWTGEPTKKQRFYVEKVIAVNAPNVVVHYYHAPREFTIYKPYQKKDKEMVTHVKYVYICREHLMNESGGIKQKHAKVIRAQLKQSDTDADEEEIEGYDEHIENPTELIRQLCEKDRLLCDKDAQIAELNRKLSEMQLGNSAAKTKTKKKRKKAKTSAKTHKKANPQK